jgi:hypothetical protein
MNIVFQNVDPVYSTNNTIAFPALVDDAKAICEISEEALQDHFGATSNIPTDLIMAFKSNRSTIEVVARRKYVADASRWLVRTEDF